jgi:beta-glucanase (GH16 family)
LNPRQYDSATYSPTPSGQNIAWGERVLNDGNTFSDTFHVFSIEWDETKIRYMIDGVHQAGRDLDLTTTGPIGPCDYGQVPNEPQLSCVGQSFNNDFFLILNVAVGGSFPGAPDETSQFPRGMLVDYVRVYQTSAQQDAQE